MMLNSAGIGGGFTHTSELIQMKNHEAMKKDPTRQSKAIDKEHTDGLWNTKFGIQC